MNMIKLTDCGKLEHDQHGWDYFVGGAHFLDNLDHDDEQDDESYGADAGVDDVEYKRKLIVRWHLTE